MSLELKEIDKKKVGFFRFKELDGKYLLTNDIGEYSFLDPLQFDLFLAGKIQSCPDKNEELKNKGFIRDELKLDYLSQKYASKNAFLGQATGLHIMVVTLRCDHRCIYCQVSPRGLKARELDMNIATAQKVVDRIFECPRRAIRIEFQGGEPLVNLNTIKFIVKYALKKNRKAKKRLRFAIVTNLTFMNEKTLEYLINNHIHICSSLDGPESIHNKQRVVGDGKNSYKNTVKWLKRLGKEHKRANISYKPVALLTVTKFSLPYAKELIDEYINLGLRSIPLRPVSPFSSSLRIWKKISYPAEEFINFYIKSLDYILDLNMKGRTFHERTATIFLKKILTDRDPNFLDIRSPCGASIGQLAYNYNGDIYTCDEGRMLSPRGDESFRLGNVKTNSYKEIMSNSTVSAMCIASCLDNLPGCSHCVYRPYCGVCPVFNHFVNGNIFTKVEYLCKVHKGILDYLFIKLQDEKIKNIFYRWIGGKK